MVGEMAEAAGEPGAERALAVPAVVPDGMDTGDDWGDVPAPERCCGGRSRRIGGCND